MNRIFFDCGSKAREKLSADSRLLSDIAKRYSCSPSDLISRLDAESESISALRSRTAALSAYVRETEKTRILYEISQDQSLSGPSCTYSSDILTVDELLKLGFSVIAETKDMLLIMMHPQSSTCLLFSSGPLSCGKLIKEHAGNHGGRGGGRDDNARAVFKSTRDMKSFAKALAEMVE
jgi:alanyl-tRNA synthetase